MTARWKPGNILHKKVHNHFGPADADHIDNPVIISPTQEGGAGGSGGGAQTVGKISFALTLKG